MSDPARPKLEHKYEWKPNVEFFTSLSADGRFIICKTVITAIKPARYFEKVLESRNERKTHGTAKTVPAADSSEA